MRAKGRKRAPGALQEFCCQVGVCRCGTGRRPHTLLLFLISLRAAIGRQGRAIKKNKSHSIASKRTNKRASE